jgi:mannose-6-phosphate isomerase-like protein (cupin superfamily)
MRPGDDNGVQPTLGERLRAARRARRYSLAEVAAATGISVSFLSLVETGGSDLTMGRLLRLADFYGVDLTELFPPTLSMDKLVRRWGEHLRIVSPDEQQETYVLAADGTHKMMPLLITFAPGGGAVERSVHEGEEFWYVISGRARVEVEGLASVELDEGDTIYFPADRPHSLRNCGDGDLRVLAVITPPIGSLLASRASAAHAGNTADRVS